MANLSTFASNVKGGAFRSVSNDGLSASFFYSRRGSRSIIFAFLTCSIFLSRLMNGIRAVATFCLPCNCSRNLSTNFLFRDGRNNVRCDCDHFAGGSIEVTSVPYPILRICRKGLFCFMSFDSRDTRNDYRWGRCSRWEYSFRYRRNELRLRFEYLFTIFFDFRVEALFGARRTYSSVFQRATSTNVMFTYDFIRFAAFCTSAILDSFRLYLRFLGIFVNFRLQVIFYRDRRSTRYATRDSLYFLMNFGFFEDRIFSISNRLDDFYSN